MLFFVVASLLVLQIAAADRPACPFPGGFPISAQEVFEQSAEAAARRPDYTCEPF